MKVFKKGNSLARLSIFAFILALLIIGSFAGCEMASLIPIQKNGKSDPGTPIEPAQTTAPPATEPIPETTIQTEPEPIRYYHPLTGLETTEQKSISRPVAVSLGNTSYALPQFGIGKSDVLFEFPIENGATRLVMLTTEYTTLEKIGGIRSTRTYISDVLAAFDPIEVYAGTSDVSASILFEGRDTLDYLTQNLGSLCYRDTSRIMPHNLMTTGSLISSEIEKLGYRTTVSEERSLPFLFTAPGTTVPAGDAACSELSITFSSSQSVLFSYQSETNTYARSQLGEKQIDGNDGTTLTFSNLIVLYSDCATYETANGSEFSLLLNGGNGYFYSEGTSHEVRWTFEGNVFSLYDADGNPLTLNRGTTYIGFVRVSDQNAVRTIR